MQRANHPGWPFRAGPSAVRWRASGHTSPVPPSGAATAAARHSAVEDAFRDIVDVEPRDAPRVLARYLVLRVFTGGAAAPLTAPLRRSAEAYVRLLPSADRERAALTRLLEIATDPAAATTTLCDALCDAGVEAVLRGQFRGATVLAARAWQIAKRKRSRLDGANASALLGWIASGRGDAARAGRWWRRARALRALRR